MSRKSSLSNIKKTPYGFVVKGNPVGCLMVFGFLFAVPGIAIITSCLGLTGVKTPEMGSGEWFGILLMGLAFFAFGAFVALAKDETIVDAKRREVRTVKGFLRYQETEVYPFSTFSDIEVKHEIEDAPQEGELSWYCIVIKAHNGQHVRLARSASLNDMLDVAFTVAEMAGIKAYDKTLPARAEITALYVAPNSSRDSAAIDKGQFNHPKGVALIEDRAVDGYSRLFKGSKNGVTFYKTVYPRMIIRALVVTCFMFGFCTNFLGWRLDIIFRNLMDGYSNPLFLKSAEVFFTTVIPSFWILLLIVWPIIGFLRLILMPPQYSLLALGKTGMFLNDQRHEKRFMRRKGRVIPYGDVMGAEVILAKNPKNFKFMKFRNCIGLRAAGEYFEIGRGLDYTQLRGIVDDIRVHCPRVQ